jgi:replication-associated recombination protein RarA
MAYPADDPWQHVRTAHDFPADEIISALQKEIRRGSVENAGLIAYEMLVTGPELEHTLWDRLCVIAVEDVGFGELQAPLLVRSLEQIAQRFNYGEHDRNLCAIHAVRYLCTRQKERTSDEMLNWIKRGVAAGELRPTIPEYALDMHTRRGQQQGRDFRHFLEEAAYVAPEVPERDRTYVDRLLAQLKAETE